MKAIRKDTFRASSFMLIEKSTVNFSQERKFSKTNKEIWSRSWKLNKCETVNRLGWY